MSDKKPVCTCNQNSKSWQHHGPHCEVFYKGCVKHTTYGPGEFE